VLTNKTAQEAVRGFGQAPTNYAIETAIDRVARHLGMDRIDLRKKNFIAKEQFPYLIPSGSTYDSGDYATVLDKALAGIAYADLVAARDASRKAGRLAASASQRASSPRAAIRLSSRCSTRRTKPPRGWILASCA